MSLGVCFYDDRYGFWSGTIQEGSGDASIQACIKDALEVSYGAALPPEGMVLPVNYVVDKNEEQQVVAKGAEMMEQMNLQPQENVEYIKPKSFQDFLESLKSNKINV